MNFQVHSLGNPLAFFLKNICESPSRPSPPKLTSQPGTPGGSFCHLLWIDRPPRGEGFLLGGRPFSHRWQKDPPDKDLLEDPLRGATPEWYDLSRASAGAVAPVGRRNEKVRRLSPCQSPLEAGQASPTALTQEPWKSSGDLGCCNGPSAKVFTLWVQCAESVV